MVEFVLASEAWGIALSGAMIITQAKRALIRLSIPFSSWPRLGWSWIRNLQERYGIRWRRAHGEEGPVDLDAVGEETVALRKLIRTYAYTDVYNMDETGFYFNNVPRGSLCINEAPALKQDKARVTLAFCTNATGTDNLPLLFIGASAKPRWLNKKPTDVLYTSTPKAWMTTTTFQAWLRDVDQSMRDQHRRILTLVDNASSHCDEDVVLTNVRLARLPPNTTAKLQPLDQGIIYCLKREELRKKMEFALEIVDEGDPNPYKVGILKGIEWCAEAWRGLPPETIQHCWLHSTLIAKSDMNFILH
ncbi:hypothetical protein PR003_g31922 [Phytophthora rubi]|nr:hypothetical protein PR003_g31922 [Phytophthora rubi]